MGIFKKKKFSKGQKIYIPWMTKYGRITQIRGGLIRIDVINPKPGQQKELLAKEHEIENGE